MSTGAFSEIVIEGAKANNLQNISLRIPHKKLIVVAGVSGSGKSSLVFDIIAQEGQRRYFESLPSFARQFMGKLNRPDVDVIEGLSPVIAISQSSTGMHARSTVGTMSDLYDFLRLLFARTGTSEREVVLSRSLFSFNSAVGKCPACNGIGKQEQIDLNRLIVSPEKTIREGALAPTLPTGYIMYSQVTIDVLNQVCEAEGFDVDIPWQDLTEDQRKVILYGSNKIKVPFGKHSLESRLKWTGIKAKPREEGYYKGMLPIMSDILRRDRNANILKYVHSVTCDACKGARLDQDALSVRVQGKSIAEVAALELSELGVWIREHSWEAVAQDVVGKMQAQIQVLEDLGLGHLSLDRSAKSLRSSEIQRIRVANQMVAPVSDVLYVFDEPSIGLHREENQRMIEHFKRLVAKGNTVVVVEHDLYTIASADHIVEIGPGAGSEGGMLLFNGALSEFLKRDELAEKSATYRALHAAVVQSESSPKANELGSLNFYGCYERNLKHIDVAFQLGKLNVVSGKSGSGKSSLVQGTLLRAVQEQLGMEVDKAPQIARAENLNAIKQVVFINHTPIGKTPRSNPATYLGLSDHIRDLYARLPESKALGFTKSRFSFNNKGGRCETCQGAGKIQIGMHFLGQVDLVCGTCNGDRFNEATLQVYYKGLSIAEVYKLSVNEAIPFFEGEKKLLAGLRILQEIGLGYLRLGQSSTTLSGGEAQRIKIANQLQKKDKGSTLFVIIEPSIGLHPKDLSSLLQLFERVKRQGNTIVCIEQNQSIISHSDWHIELGPENGVNGGQVMYQGIPKAQESTGRADKVLPQRTSEASNEVILEGVSTHGLKDIDVRIPKNEVTVVTGVSGSGKTSLVYDTLFAESNARFTESLSAYNRSFLQQNSQARIRAFSGLGPAIGINRKGRAASKRSTVATLSGISDAVRLLYSRIAQQEGKHYSAQHFSFNHHLGACPACEGLGLQSTCNPDEIIVDPEKSLWEGATAQNKALTYYTDPKGQFMATLREAAKNKGWNIDASWKDLDSEVQQAILYGTGEEEWDVTWEFSTKTRQGIQHLKAKWLGLCEYINDEYERRLHNKNIAHLEQLMHDVLCPTCQGSRLKADLLQVRFKGKNIHELSKMDIARSLRWLEEADSEMNPAIRAIAETVLAPVKATMQALVDLGLEYLSLDRSIRTLSGGERQRVNLAGQLSSHLFGVTYVLDEPTIGLDTEQVSTLSKMLKRIAANGNTVVVVEHDSGFIKAADYLIEMGPGAGSLGGEVMYQGKLKDVAKVENTLTHQLLRDTDQLTLPKVGKKGRPFGLKGAYANNLKNVDLTLYAGQIIGVTGVSGSGKSSLVKDVLYHSWTKKRPVNCHSVFGFEQFENVVLMDQEPVGTTRLSTPVSYTGILDLLRTLYSRTEDAQQSGLKKADFSYQSKKGKCPMCNGHGEVKTSMDFMSDVWLTCDTCKGLRYSEPILACTHKDLSIGQLLQMTVHEVIDFLGEGAATEGLKVLEEVGLGHLVLGQSGHTLSGGEMQRLKLARSLWQQQKGATLYLFDEPSTGLHYQDILRLIKVFQSIVDRGDTLLFIEHNSTLLQAAQQIVRMGPGSGVEGGRII